MKAGILGTYGQLFRTAWTYVATGALWRLTKLRRGPVIAALYPIVILLLQLLLALLVGGLAAWALRGMPWLAVPVGLALAWVVLVLGRRLDHKIFAYYLMHDYAFTAAHRGAYPAALEARLVEFRRELQDALTEDLDEVLVVGHSSGAYLAVSLIADLIRAGQPKGPDLSLLTLGHVVPMAAFLPEAKRLRADLALAVRGAETCSGWTSRRRGTPAASRSATRSRPVARRARRSAGRWSSRPPTRRRCRRKSSARSGTAGSGCISSISAPSTGPAITTISPSLPGR